MSRPAGRKRHLVEVGAVEDHGHLHDPTSASRRWARRDRTQPLRHGLGPSAGDLHEDRRTCENLVYLVQVANSTAELVWIFRGLRVDEESGFPEPDHAAHQPVASTLTPARSRAVRTARAIAGAPGVSPCRQMVSATTSTQVPFVARDATVSRDRHRLVRRLPGVCQQVAGLATRDERPVRAVPAVGECLSDRADTGRRGGEQRGSGGRDDGYSWKGLDDSSKELRTALVDGCLVVERAVRLHVVHPRPVIPGDGIERADLGEQLGSQQLGGGPHHSATEALAVRVRRVCPDADSEAHSGGDRRIHHGRVPGMSPRRDVGARHDFEQGHLELRRILDLADVGVQVDGHWPAVRRDGYHSTSIARARPSNDSSREKPVLCARWKGVSGQGWMS